MRPLQTHLVPDGKLTLSGFLDGDTIRDIKDGRVLARLRVGKWSRPVWERSERAQVTTAPSRAPVERGPDYTSRDHDALWEARPVWTGHEWRPVLTWREWPRSKLFTQLKEENAASPANDSGAVRDDNLRDYRGGMDERVAG